MDKFEVDINDIILEGLEGIYEDKKTEEKALTGTEADFSDREALVSIPEQKSQVKEKLLRYKNYCVHCGVNGEGIPDDLTECPYCHKQKIKQTLEQDLKGIPSHIKVPEKYVSVDWDIEKARNNIEVLTTLSADKKGKALYENWLFGLQKLLNAAEQNTIMRDSYIITGIGGSGKHIWAYSFIRNLAKNKVSISPILFINELNPDSAHVNKTQMLIIWVTRLNFKENINKLDFILNKRKLLDLPTVVVSEVPYGKFISDVDGSLLYFDQKIIQA